MYMSDSKNKLTEDRAVLSVAPDDMGFLDLPDAPDFISDEPGLTFIENLRLCEQMLPVWNVARFQEQEPWAKTTLEFYL